MKAFRPAGVLLFCLSIGGSATSPAAARRGCRGGGQTRSGGASLPSVPQGRHDARQLRRAGAGRRSGGVFDADVGVDGQPQPSSRRYCRPIASTGSGRRTTPSRRERRATSKRARKPTTRSSPPTSPRRSTTSRPPTDPAKRLGIVERARRRLADWPPTHYNYKQSDVRQMLGMLDEVIADLRAATGAQRFDLESRRHRGCPAGRRAVAAGARSAGDHRADAVGRLAHRFAGGAHVAARRRRRRDRSRRGVPAGGLGRRKPGRRPPRRLPASSRSIACIDVWRPRCFASRTSARARPTFAACSSCSPG